MTAQSVPPPDFSAPAVDTDGFLTRAWQAFLSGLYDRVGRDFDKVEAAHAIATAAVP
ncbi:MAG: hypothetical protein M3Y22_14670 [Pseudomonadota bacterium]|nr:hypothetical protein [Pseudomonadota bacterium]